MDSLQTILLDAIMVSMKIRRGSIIIANIAGRKTMKIVVGKVNGVERRKINSSSTSVQ
jgi:hypothetical protein